MKNKEFGARLKLMREQKGVTLKVMAELIGVGISTYSSKESRADFSDAEMAKVLKKLGTTKEAIEKMRLPGLRQISSAESLIAIESTADVILSAVAEILAKQTGQSVTATQNQLTIAVKERYERKLGELLK